MKIVIVGGGNAGVWTALHYGYYTQNIKDVEVELIFNPDIDPVPVGQGTLVSALQLLETACGPNWYTNEVRATPKFGIVYENWNKKNKDILSFINFNSLAMHIDPKHLQKYILNSGWFGVKEGNVTDLDEVDADVIFDCRGNVDKGHAQYEDLYCPVNSVLLATSSISDRSQNWTRAVATPDGWTFVIPNAEKTTSYGYLYNKDITPLKDASANFSEIFGEEFPNEMKPVNLNFDSYMSKEPVRIDSNGRKIILNGNRLSFLEPLEATAIEFYIWWAKNTYDWVVNGTVDNGVNELTSRFNKHMKEIHTFILWHYTNGSLYDTPFWKSAKEKTTTIFEQPNEIFQSVVNTIKLMNHHDCRAADYHSALVYGQWQSMNIKNWYDGYIKFGEE